MRGADGRGIALSHFGISWVVMTDYRRPPEGRAVLVQALCRASASSIEGRDTTPL